jgi:hypothetical protein
MTFNYFLTLFAITGKIGKLTSLEPKTLDIFRVEN